MPKDLKFSGGWIKLYRVLMHKAIWKCSRPPQKVVLVQIMMEANWELNEWLWKGKKYKCQPGEFITSIKALAEGAGVSVKSVRTALANFSTIYSFLEYEGTSVSTKIKVLNWKEYQDDMRETDKAPASEAADEGQSRGKVGATNKEEKEVKEEKKPPKPPKKKDNKKDKTTPHPIDKIKDAKLNVKALKSFFDWRQDERKPKAPMGPKAITLAYRHLVQFSHKVQQEIVDKSILSNWQGLFDPDTKKGEPRKKEKLPDNYFDPYDSPIFKRDCESNKARMKNLKPPKELDDSSDFDHPVEDIDWESLTTEERQKKWQELKKEACRKLSA